MPIETLCGAPSVIVGHLPCRHLHPRPPPVNRRGTLLRLVLFRATYLRGV